MKRFVNATAFALVFAAGPVWAADAPHSGGGVNTGLKARSPSENSVGVKGAPGNKNGPAMQPNASSSGSSSGEAGTASGPPPTDRSGAAHSDLAVGVKGAPGNKNGPAEKPRDSTPTQ